MERKFQVSGFGKTFAVKINKYSMPAGTKYSIFFGGPHKHCLTFGYDTSSPESVYLNLVEYNEGCAIGDILRRGGDTAKLVKVALYVIKKMFPSADRVTFEDDSHIFCESAAATAANQKISLAHDSILKYNMTWYEKHFGARLPGDLYDKYRTSLHVLDDSAMLPMGYFMDHVTTLSEEEKGVYMQATSMRDFMGRLRDMYGDEYCSHIHGWFHTLMGVMGINLYSTQWYIPYDAIVRPANYRERLLAGGKRNDCTRRRSKRNGGHHGKRIAAHTHGRIIGGWGDIDV